MNKCMRIICLFITAVMFLSAFILISSQASTIAPDFNLNDVNNQPVTLSSYRDKSPVLLFFWTTWCPYCLSQLKLLNKMYPGLVKDGIEVLAVNLREAKAKVEKFIKRYDINYRVLLDSDAEAAYAYDILGIPTYVLIDKKGNIVFSDNYFPEKEYKDLLLK